MKINIVSIGTNMPSWIRTGYYTYADRLKQACYLNLIEVTAEKRYQKYDTKNVIQEEGKKLLAAVPHDSRVILLHEQGQQWDTMKLADNMQRWIRESYDISLIIGGPDGLDVAIFNNAEFWSLSALTFPHLLVRILIAEQIYRAWSLLCQHPYHRGKNGKLSTF